MSSAEAKSSIFDASLEWLTKLRIVYRCSE